MLVLPFKLTVPVPVEKVPDPVCEKLPDVVMPVAPVSAPAAEILTVGEVRMLVNPVPTVIALKVLLVCDVTLPKLSPVRVFDPEPFAVPTRLTPSPFTAVVPLDAESVIAKVDPVPVLLV